MKHYKKTINKLKNNHKYTEKLTDRLLDKLQAITPEEAFNNPALPLRLCSMLLKFNPFLLGLIMQKALLQGRLEQINEEKRKELKTNKVVNFDDYR